ncbi:24803_t:CDS:2, partial [Gigaspora margarita]
MRRMPEERNKVSKNENKGRDKKETKRMNEIRKAYEAKESIIKGRNERERQRKKQLEKGVRGGSEKVK